jgi:hypothetical protein
MRPTTRKKPSLRAKKNNAKLTKVASAS